MLKSSKATRKRVSSSSSHSAADAAAAKSTAKPRHTPPNTATISAKATAADQQQPIMAAQVHPKKRGRPFKQNLSKIRRDDDDEQQYENNVRPIAPMEDGPKPSDAAPKPRPPRRVKSDIKYRNTDTESNSDDDDDDDDAVWMRTVAPVAPTPPKTQRTPATATTSPAIPNTTPMYPCPLCSYSFKRNGWLRSHMKRTHNEDVVVSHSHSVDASAVQPVRHSTAGSDGDDEYPRHRMAGNKTLQRHTVDVLPLSDAAASIGDSIADIAPIKAYFDSLNPQHSATITTHLDHMFRQTTKLMMWLKRQTARPERLDDFESVHAVQRELLAKQLKLYDTASQMIAAKRDSLKFTYDDFVQRHSAEVDDDDRALEDYSYPVCRSDSLVLDGQTLVSRSDSLVPDGRPSNGLQSSDVGAGSRAYGGLNGSGVVSQRNQTTQTDDGGDSRSEIRIKDGDDFEFLDSKTGKLFTNKTTPNMAQPAAADCGDDEDDEEYQLLEVIDVDEEDEENVDRVAAVSI